MQILIYILGAIIVLGIFVFSIAITTALKSEDKERASVLIGHTIVGLVMTIVVIVIMLILK